MGAALRPYAVAACLSLVCAVPAAAQDSRRAEIEALRRQIEAMKEDQARRLAEITQQTDAQINALKSALDRIEGKPSTAPALAEVLPKPVSQPVAAPVATAAAGSSPLLISGDFRLRYESNFGDESARNRNRGVLRGRLGATYKILDWLTVGGRITTGDANDPNSADIELSNFDNDFQVSLDQAYLAANFGNAQIMGGRMPQPFTRTELLWDNDVNPQGLSASYKVPLGKAAALKATGLYFLIDEATGGPDADMAGAQIGFEYAPSAVWKAEIAAAYYDYAVRTTGTADAGDFRTNLVDTSRRYLSDFNLGDLVGSVTYLGLGEPWPVTLTGDYVKNFGAFTAADTGYWVDLAVGKTSRPGDWKFGYGYAVADADAVFAAFSQDNTTLGSNYKQHTLSADYVPVRNIVLNATLYHYRLKDNGGALPYDWLNRIRFNFLVNF